MKTNDPIYQIFVSIFSVDTLKLLDEWTDHLPGVAEVGITAVGNIPFDLELCERMHKMKKKKKKKKLDYLGRKDEYLDLDHHI